MQYCSLQHWTSLALPDTSISVCHSCFGPATSFFLELLVIALHSSPVAYCTPSDLGGALIFWCHIFLTFHTVCGLAVRITGVVFNFVFQWTTFCQNSSPLPVCWVALLGMAHSLIELCKPVHHDKPVIHEGDVYIYICYILTISIKEGWGMRGV